MQENRKKIQDAYQNCFSPLKSNSKFMGKGETEVSLMSPQNL